MRSAKRQPAFDILPRQRQNHASMATTVCQACGSEVSTQLIICPDCAAPVGYEGNPTTTKAAQSPLPVTTSYCPACRNPVVVGSKRCLHCGIEIELTAGAEWLKSLEWLWDDSKARKGGPDGPLPQFCRKGEYGLEIVPSWPYGLRYVFDRTEQVLSIRSQVLGFITLAQKELAFRDISTKIEVKTIKVLVYDFLLRGKKEEFETDIALVLEGLPGKGPRKVVEFQSKRAPGVLGPLNEFGSRLAGGGRRVSFDELVVVAAAIKDLRIEMTSPPQNIIETVAEGSGVGENPHLCGAAVVRPRGGVRPVIDARGAAYGGADVA